MVAKEEGMVLNAEAVKIAGEQDVAKMIKDAEDYVRASGKEAKDDRVRSYGGQRRRHGPER